MGFAHRLNAADLLAADDLLATMAHVSLRLRAEVLGKVADPAAAGSLAQRVPILVRLADLQIGMADYDKAYQSTLELSADLGRVLSGQSPRSSRTTRIWRPFGG